MGGTAYTGSRPGYVYTTRHGVTDYYPDAARPSLLTRLASWPSIAQALAETREMKPRLARLL